MKLTTLSSSCATALLIGLTACADSAASDPPVPGAVPLATSSSASSASSGGALSPALEVSGAGSADSTALDPRLSALIDAVDRARTDRVQTLLPRVESLSGVLVEIAKARAQLLLGQAVDSLAALESLRRRYPDNPDVLASTAEVYALLGESVSAEDVLRAGMAVDPEHPALERARGVYLLLQSGGAAAALQHLELATLADPGLRYAARPLAEARRLVARQAMGAGDPDRAEQHVLGALEYDPDHVGTRLLLADVLAAQLNFEGAIELQEQLLAEGAGRPQELALLHKRAAMAQLLIEERESAIQHFLRARDLGLDGDLLGWGAQALRDEAEARLDSGLALFEEGDVDGALGALEEARRLDPESLEIPHKLGAILFRAGRHAAAAQAWSELLTRSLADGRELPVPVHLDLARAWRMTGQPEQARTVLEAYLAREPEGVWAEATAEMLTRLDG